MRVRKWRSFGDRFLLEAEMTDADRQAIANVFGDEFADGFLRSSPGKWSGPLKSGYGMHLVFVTEREAGRPPHSRRCATRWLRSGGATANRDPPGLSRKAARKIWGGVRRQREGAARTATVVDVSMQ